MGVRIAITHEYTSDDEDFSDCYELATDEDGYNPTMVRDMRDVVLSMWQGADPDLAEISTDEDTEPVAADDE